MYVDTCIQSIEFLHVRASQNCTTSTDGELAMHLEIKQQLIAHVFDAASERPRLKRLRKKYP